MAVSIRLLSPRDSMESLTELLHRSYAPAAAAGLRFLASHQDVATTRKRCGEGECYLAEEGGHVVGTITWRPHSEKSPCTWYRRPDVAIFGQFGVDSGTQRKGIGRALLETAERRAREAGRRELACDTAEHAADLIRLYQKWGYRLVDRVNWGEIVNYESVILSKTLVP